MAAAYVRGAQTVHLRKSERLAPDDLETRDDLAQLAASGVRHLEPGQAPTICGYTAALLAAFRAHDESEDDIICPVIAGTTRRAVDLAPLSDDQQAIAAASGRASQVLASFTTEPGTHAARGPFSRRRWS